MNEYVRSLPPRFAMSDPAILVLELPCESIGTWRANLTSPACQQHTSTTIGAYDRMHSHRLLVHWLTLMSRGSAVLRDRVTFGVASASAQTSSERPFYSLHADAYDLLINDPVDPWVDAVHARLTSAGWLSASVLDAGCGTGRHAAGLIARGHRVDLVDASAELLSLAARRCPSARTSRADLCTVRFQPAYDAVTCRGVLNDMITEQERASAVNHLTGSLRPGGLLFLDVREMRASRERADGITRTRRVDLGDGASLSFHARSTWREGTLQVEERYDLVRPGAAVQRSSYAFTMRPWTEPELRAILRASGLGNVEIGAGVGRRTADRLFVVAS